MTYQIIVLKNAQRDLAGLDAAMRQRVGQKLRSLAENPRGPDTIKLITEDSYRTRVGDYRIIFTIDDASKTVTVTSIRHRREVYR